MLADSPIISLIPVTDPAQSREFYEQTLGLRFVADDGFAQVFAAGGRWLRLTKVERLDVQPFSIIGWRVDDIAGKVRGLGEAGVRFERYPGLEQDELGIWSVPGDVAKVAWFKDPDGNTLSLVQAPEGQPEG